MIRQFTYTASPWGKTGAGWMVFQQSRNVSPDETKSLYPVYRYEGLPAEGGEDPHPVQFVYIPAKTGKGAILAQTTFAGMRWFDPRPGDFFSHVLMLDENAVERSSAAGINPVRLFRSNEKGGLQFAFPESLKEKALAIFRKTSAWEPPPELPTLVSLADVRDNPGLHFETSLGRLSPRAVRQLGSIVRAMFVRRTGNSPEPVVFNGRNESSVSVMVLALDLFPSVLRTRTWFAVQFRESALRRLPGFSSLTFYGTDVDRPSDPDTGVVSGVDLDKDPFRFRNANDIRKFKKNLDALGQDVSIEDYKALVICWEMSSGEKNNGALLRSTWKFVNRFPKFKKDLFAGIVASVGSGSGDLDFPLVAHFELGLASDVITARVGEICGACIRKKTVFCNALEAIETEEGRASFLDAVYDMACTEGGGRPALARTWLSCATGVRNMARRANSKRFGPFVSFVDKFERLHQIVAENRLPVRDAARSLKTVDDAVKWLGLDFDGVENARNKLRYLVAVENIQSVADFPAFLDQAEMLHINSGTILADVFRRVNLGQLRIHELAKIVDAFKEHRLPVEAVVGRIVKTAEERGRANRLPWFAVFLVGLVCLLLGASAGWSGSFFFSSRRVKDVAAGKAPTSFAETTPSQPRSDSDESVTDPGPPVPAVPGHDLFQPSGTKEQSVPDGRIQKKRKDVSQESSVGFMTDRKSADGGVGRERSGIEFRRDFSEVAERGKADGAHSGGPPASAESILAESTPAADVIDPSDGRINGNGKQ